MLGIRLSNPLALAVGIETDGKSLEEGKTLNFKGFFLFPMENREVVFLIFAGAALKRATSFIFFFFSYFQVRPVLKPLKGLSDQL